MGLIWHLVTWGGQATLVDTSNKIVQRVQRECPQNSGGWVGGQQSNVHCETAGQPLAKNFKYLRCAEQREIHGQAH